MLPPRALLPEHGMTSSVLVGSSGAISLNADEELATAV
jgi:hypothetical protein